MEIIHRISINSSPGIQRELRSLEIAIADSGLVSFEVAESNKAWPAIKEWSLHRRALDVPRTKFSNKEIANARWLELVPDWHHGYPQPAEDVFGYRLATYDLTDWCELCDVGIEQKAPFQMKGEPKWGKKGVLQLNWIFDEYFSTPDVWVAVFKPHGISCRTVTNVKGVELKTVVQLVTHEEIGVVTEGLGSEEARCSKCGRTKYLPVARGCFPPLTSEPSTAMVKTKEYFGSGASACKRVIVSQNVAHSATASGLSGVSFRPVAATWS